jgi:zinc protease
MTFLTRRQLLLFGSVLFSIGILSAAHRGAGPRADQAPPAKGPNPALQAATAFYEGILTDTLPNGLHVYLKPIPESPVVTTMVAYKVGSADENLDHTGLSHYLEHLMFKGTDKIMPGDIDRLTLRRGGQNNAYTSEDYTIYHFDFAADRWEAALEIEADRMRHLRIDAKHEFEQEKGAVIAELERNEDEPWDLEVKAILPMLFDNGPYGHPVIGERQHVRGATADIIKSHYDRWYYPNNASLVICGGFDPQGALAKVKELFGPLPKGNLPERKATVESKRNAPVRKEIDSKFESPRLVMGFNTVRLGDADSYPLEVASGLLTNGKTGRLYKKLVEGEEVANSVDSSNNSGRYPGWFAIQVELQKGKDRDRTEKLVLAELQALRDQPVSPAELERVQHTLIANAIYSRESVHGLADSIARGVTTNDLDYLKSYLSRIQAVTAQDVQKVARKYFNAEQRAVVWSVPKMDGGGSRIEDRGSRYRAGSGRLFDPPPSILHPRSSILKFDAGGVGGFSLKNTHRVVLPNGLTLVLLENRRLPIVVADASVRWVTLLEPEAKAGVATLMGMLLDEGTVRHTGTQIAEMIEDVGGSLSFNSSSGSVKVLSSDRSLGLNLLFECLSQATFPKDAFARKQAQLLSFIDDTERQPDAKARLVYRHLAYGKHPYGRPTLGTRKTVEPLAPADCQAFYRQTFAPNNTVVVIVGDFDSKQVIEEVTRLTADWKQSPVTRPRTPPVERPQKFVEQILTMPAAAQLHFLMGHAGIARNNPDYYKLLVMDYVLGTGPGFTDRLSARLRDREGLAYTVSANITSSAKEEPGLFSCYIGTNPNSLARVKQMFLEELTRIRSEKPSTQEVEDAKKYLQGNIVFQFTTNGRIAEELLLVERYQLGLNYLDDYRKAVAAVTPEDVQAVARKYIDPEHMVLVVAGAVDQEGKPLEKLPQPKK